MLGTYGSGINLFARSWANHIAAQPKISKTVSQAKSMIFYGFSYAIFTNGSNCDTI